MRISSAYFDLYGTDFAVNTGWVGPTTGILVDTADPTSISDLFGNSSTSGFAALQALDSNDDGVLNSSDPGFSGLYVWEDANGNGTADAGEVQSLSSLGITSISLNSTEVDETVNGNVVGSVATFTDGSTSTGEVAEAFFDNSAMDSAYDGSYTLNPEALTLPNLRGYGTVPDLYIAMSQDPTLLGMVQNLATDSLADAATYDQQVTDIIYEWAGVSAVDPASRGDYVDAQELGALEAFTGESWTTGSGSDPTSGLQGRGLEAAWNDLFAAVKERLLAQGPLASLLSGVSYDYDTDSLTGTTDFSALVTAIDANIPADSATAVQYLASIGQFMDQLASDLSVSASDYDSTLETDFADAGQSLTLTAVDDLHYLVPTFDSNGNAVFTPDAVGAIADGIVGSNNILEGSGDITGVVVNNVQTLDTTGVTLTADQLAGFSNITGGGGEIDAAAGGTYDLSSLTVTGEYDMFADSNDGTTLIGNSADGQSLYASTSGDDTLEAGSGSGDYLYAGGGADTLVGGSGSTTFELLDGAVSGTTLEGGDGSNTLDFNGDISGLTVSGIQTLETTSITLTADQLAGFSAITGGGGQIYAEAGGTYDLSGATVTGEYDMFAESNDGTTLIGNSANGQSLYASTSGDDTLEAGSGTGDYLYGGGGVDTLVGGSGSDTFDLLDGPVAGSTIEGGIGTNVLDANGDISGLTISGIQTLETNSITLTADQLAGFGAITGGGGQIYAASGGTYDLSGLTVTGEYDMFAENNDGTTLIGNGDNGQSLYASTSGDDTLEAGAGTGDFLYGYGGVDTLVGGSGSDTFASLTGSWASGTTLEGGDGTNVLDTNSDISGVTISGIQTLETNSITLTADQLAGFDAITGGGGQIYAASGGTYDLSGLTVTGEYDMFAENNDGTTLIGNGANGQSLYASTSGDDTLEAGSGTGDFLYGYGGVDTLIGGSGSDTFASLTGSWASGTTLEGGDGTNVLDTNSDISGLTISGIQTLETNSITLTADQLAGFDAITGGGGQIYAAAGGTYDLSGLTVTGEYDMLAESNDGTTLIGNSANGQSLEASASGDDTLEAGSGTSDSLFGGGGYDTYKFGASFGQDTVFNDGGASASGEIDFLGGTTDEDLWFQQSGNDLVVDLLGTSDQVTIDNWYSSAGAQVTKFTADGQTLDSQISTLVSAMATYATANPGFDPATAMAMPSDTTLQSAIASAWHT